MNGSGLLVSNLSRGLMVFILHHDSHTNSQLEIEGSLIWSQGQDDLHRDHANGVKVWLEHVR